MILRAKKPAEYSKKWTKNALLAKENKSIAETEKKRYYKDINKTWINFYIKCDLIIKEYTENILLGHCTKKSYHRLRLKSHMLKSKFRFSLILKQIFFNI
jgi:hypothetical protein